MMEFKQTEFLMSSSSRRFLVRDRTSLSHARVEAAVGSFETLEAYRRYLRGSYIFRAELEKQMAAVRWPAQFSLWSASECLSDLMLQDMDDLDMLAPAGPSAVSPSVVSSDVESLLGMLYVVEGSSLGARVLYRRARSLGLTESYGARHLAHQSQSNERWSRLLQLLEAAPDLNLDRTVQASEATFDAVERAFSDPKHA
jgi:heme oxygenase